MQQLSGLDASFLYFETPNAPMHIGSLSIYDQSTAPGGLVTFKSILRNVEERLHRARCFRQKLAKVPFDLDHPYWIEDDGMGIIHAIFSYCGELTITATSCRELMPDPAFYAECLDESFNELSRATLGGDRDASAGRS